MNQSVGILAQQTVIRGVVRKCDGVGLGFGSVSLAVENDETERFRTRHKFAFSSWLFSTTVGCQVSENILAELRGGTWLFDSPSWQNNRIQKVPVPIPTVQYSDKSTRQKE